METDCIHHWIIDLATEPKSKGRCKRCRAVKIFSNTPEDIKALRINSVTGVATMTRDITFGRGRD
jgi:hypothetical protein